MMKARDDVKQGNIFQRQRKFKSSQEPLQKGMEKPLKPVPIFKQKPGEHKR